MKNPTTIQKTSTKGEHTRFLDIAYNGKKLGRVGIFNIFTNAGVQGVRIVWQEENKPYSSEKGKDGIVYEYTDEDEYGNIKHTK